MKNTCRLAATTLALALALSACGSDAEEPAAPEAQDTATEAPTEAADDEHDDHADPAEEDPHANHGGSGETATDPVLVHVLGTSTGVFAPVDDGHAGGAEVIEGTAVLQVTESGTSVLVRAAGLLPGQTYASHLHDGACSAVGGHYQHDPAGPMAPPNEIWASSSDDPGGDLEPNQQGVANGAGEADWLPRQQPLSIQIHAPVFPGLPISCADFAEYDGPVTLLLEAHDTHGADLETIEYSLDGGETVVYDEPVQISESGTHTLQVQGRDAAGEATEPQEVSFVVGQPA